MSTLEAAQVLVKPKKNVKLPSYKVGENFSNELDLHVADKYDWAILRAGRNGIIVLASVNDGDDYPTTLTLISDKAEEYMRDAQLATALLLPAGQLLTLISNVFNDPHVLSRDAHRATIRETKSQDATGETDTLVVAETHSTTEDYHG